LYDHTLFNPQLRKPVSYPLLKLNRLFAGDSQDLGKAYLADNFSQRSSLEANIFSFRES
jgi:hypothetical protein